MNLGTATVIRGNARHLPLADNTVDLVVSSPPYWSLRAYQDNGETYDGQIGAEPTPAQYVDSLIEVTAECMRVLKPSGSIWINLGDKMSSGEPYDNTLTVGDAAWLAGLIDADGTITVRRTRQPTMRAVTYEGIVAVEQIDRDAVERAAAITGRGAICEVNRTNSRSKMYRWTASTQQARWIAERIWPWLRIKQRQALAIVELGRHRETCQARGRYAQIKPEWVEYRELICSAVRAWNQREAHDWAPPLLPVIELPTMPRRVPPKSLTGLPWRYALRCIDDLGLILRAEIIWGKPNGLPESVTDRVRRSHEQWFHFTLEPRYFSAVDEIREPTDIGRRPVQTWAERKAAGNVTHAPDNGHSTGVGMTPNPLGKLPGSVWTVPTEPLQVPTHLGVDHFAAFPTEWPRRIIMGWSPVGVCTGCGQGRRPVTSKAPDLAGWYDQAAVAKFLAQDEVTVEDLRRVGGSGMQEFRDAKAGGTRGYHLVDHATADVIDRVFRGWTNRVIGMATGSSVITGYACGCVEPTAPTTPSVILDPFGGTGTTALVAKALGRHGISIDMSADYGRLARWRTNDLDQLAKVQGIKRSDAARAADGLDMDTLFDFDGGAA